MSTTWKNIIIFLIVAILVSLAIYYLSTLLSANEIIGAFLIHLLAGTLVAFVFLFMVLFFLRPSIRISPDIAKNIDHFENDKTCYSFKMINLSWFSAYEIEIEVNELIVIPVDGGQNIRYTKIPIKRSNITHLSPYRPQWINPNYGRHALQIRVYEDIDSIIKTTLKSVQIEVTLRHGLTGLTKVFNRDYSVQGRIREGQFVFGNSFDVV